MCCPCHFAILNISLNKPNITVCLLSGARWTRTNYTFIRSPKTRVARSLIKHTLLFNLPVPVPNYDGVSSKAPRERECLDVPAKREDAGSRWCGNRPRCSSLPSRRSWSRAAVWTPISSGLEIITLAASGQRWLIWRIWLISKGPPRPCEARDELCLRSVRRCARGVDREQLVTHVCRDRREVLLKDVYSFKADPWISESTETRGRAEMWLRVNGRLSRISQLSERGLGTLITAPTLHRSPLKNFY